MSDIPVMPGGMILKGDTAYTVGGVAVDRLPDGFIELILVAPRIAKATGPATGSTPRSAVVFRLSPKQAAFLEFRLLVEREEAGGAPYTPPLPE